MVGTSQLFKFANYDELPEAAPKVTNKRTTRPFRLFQRCTGLDLSIRRCQRFKGREVLVEHPFLPKSTICLTVKNKEPKVRRIFLFSDSLVILRIFYHRHYRQQLYKVIPTFPTRRQFWFPLVPCRCHAQLIDESLCDILMPKLLARYSYFVTSANATYNNHNSNQLSLKLSTC